MSGRVYVETDKSKELQYGLLNPHYTDDRFRGDPKTVFLAPGFTTKAGYGGDTVEGVSYEYSDRLHEWHGEKCDAAWKVASEKGFNKNSAEVMEAYLRELLGDPDLQLVHVVAGVNHSNGYPYRVYGYVSGKKETAE